MESSAPEERRLNLFLLPVALFGPSMDWAVYHVSYAQLILGQSSVSNANLVWKPGSISIDWLKRSCFSSLLKILKISHVVI